jgi:hypothetical protein
MSTAKDAYIVARVQELQAAKGLTFEQGMERGFGVESGSVGWKRGGRIR